MNPSKEHPFNKTVCLCMDRSEHSRGASRQRLPPEGAGVTGGLGEGADGGGGEVRGLDLLGAAGLELLAAVEQVLRDGLLGVVCAAAQPNLASVKGGLLGVKACLSITSIWTTMHANAEGERACAIRWQQAVHLKHCFVEDNSSLT